MNRVRSGSCVVAEMLECYPFRHQTKPDQTFSTFHFTSSCSLSRATTTTTVHSKHTIQPSVHLISRFIEVNLPILHQTPPSLRAHTLPSQWQPPQLEPSTVPARCVAMIDPYCSCIWTPGNLELGFPRGMLCRLVCEEASRAQGFVRIRVLRIRTAP